MSPFLEAIRLSCLKDWWRHQRLDVERWSGSNAAQLTNHEHRWRGCFRERLRRTVLPREFSGGLSALDMSISLASRAFRKTMLVD